MAATALKNASAISMRFRADELRVIDRGAALAGLSRTEFMTRAAIHDAQLEILNARVVDLSADGWAQFDASLQDAKTVTPPKLKERLSRKAPWATA